MPDQTRVAVRILLLDLDSRVLLFEGQDLSDSDDSIRFWFTAGGGCGAHETLREAATRELFEETGQSGIELVGPFHRRDFDFLNHGEPQHQIEHFFAARTNDSSLSDAKWTELERQAMTRWRWWSVDELLAENVRYFPDNLTELVTASESLV